MTPTLAEIHARSVRFHAEIARRAALVKPPEVRVIHIPNTPFGVPKIAPTPEPNIEPMYWYSMWFYDLVFGKPRKPATGPSVRRIQSVVADAYGFSTVEFLADRRTMPLVRARQIAMYLAKTMTSKSLPEIGRMFGGRDHTTVVHAVRKIGQMISADAEFAGRVDELKREILA